MPDRYAAIMELMDAEGKVLVEELASTLRVSVSTIRRDLDALASQGMVRRIHGGAIALRRNGDIRPFSVRLEQHYDEKLRIAKAAAELVSPGMQIGVDGGTTTALLVPFLLEVGELTVVTNSIKAASELTSSEKVKLFLLGGQVDAVSLSTSGPWTASQLGDVYLSKVFLGVAGVDPAVGLTTGLFEQIQTKRALIHRAQEVIVLADHTKIGAVSSFFVADVTSVSTIITGMEAAAKLVAEIRQKGVTVVQV